MSDPQFSGDPTNVPGVPHKERKVQLTVSSAGSRVRLGDTLALKVQNETGYNVTSQVTYVTKDRTISVTASGLIHGISPGSFKIAITDAAGGTAVFEGECFA